MSAQKRSAVPGIAGAALAFLCLVVTSACGPPPPIKYYVLEPATTPASAAAPQFSITLLVARVTSSHLYRDDRLVYGNGPVQLGTYEYQRWSESPVDLVQDSLIGSLRATNQYRSVSAIGSNLRGEYILRAHLIALSEVDGPQLAARFAMELDLYSPRESATLWTGSYSHDEPVNGKAVPDVIEALDRNVRAGMQQLTTSLGQYFASHPPQPFAAR